MTNLTVLANKINADHTYQSFPGDYVALDLLNDYFIWTKGGAGVADGDDEPTPAELNTAATIIDPLNPVTVEKSFIFDQDEGAGTIRLIDGMKENKRYVFGFSFDGPTASEPQLEAWDDTNHNTTDFHVLGAGTPANSMIKAICTTDDLPGVDWPGAALAGASNVLLLNNGNGALPALVPPATSQEVYANIKIKIPAGYATPAIEPFIFAVRYSWN